MATAKATATATAKATVMVMVTAGDSSGGSDDVDNTTTAAMAGNDDTRLVIPVFRNLFFGPKKAFLTGFLRIFFLRFPEEFFTGTWFWRGSQ